MLFSISDFKIYGTTICGMIYLAVNRLIHTLFFFLQQNSVKKSTEEIT